MKRIKYATIMIAGISVTFDCFTQPRIFVKTREKVGRIVQSYTEDKAYVMAAAYFTCLAGVTFWAGKKTIQESEKKRACPCRQTLK